MDRNIVGVLERPGGQVRVIRAVRNTDWQHGQGTFFVSHARGDMAVVSESGQRRSDYLTATRHYILDLKKGSMKQVKLAEDFSGYGRQVGYFYLLDDKGLMLFVNRPSGEKDGKDPSGQDVWLRTPSGEYLRVASGADYYGFQNREVIYWTFDERRLHAYNVDTGSDRTPDRFIPGPPDDPAIDVRVSSPDGKELELWEKKGDEWTMKYTVLDVSKIK